MKKMFFLSTMAILGTSSVFWGCKNDVVLAIPENEQGRLKSGEIVAEKNYSLVTKNNREVGQMTVSNDNDYLTLEFAGYGSSVSEVQLWVGTDPSMVPKNKQNIPVPGKFTYKQSGNAVFSIRLSDLFTPVPGGSCNGKEVFIFAHAEMKGSGFDDDDEKSVWSEGTPFGTSRWGSYSTYITSCKPKGCLQYSALGGNTEAGEVYYYDNTVEGEVIQDIHAENGEIAGTVRYNSETMSFSFGQDWMFLEQLPAPTIIIYGYEVPGLNATLVYEGEPIPNQGPFTVPVSYHPYYKIQLNVQNCY